MVSSKSVLLKLLECQISVSSQAVPQVCPVENVASFVFVSQDTCQHSGRNSRPASRASTASMELPMKLDLPSDSRNDFPEVFGPKRSQKIRFQNGIKSKVRVLNGLFNLVDKNYTNRMVDSIGWQSRMLCRHESRTRCRWIFWLDVGQNMRRIVHALGRFTNRSGEWQEWTIECSSVYAEWILQVPSRVMSSRA